jgi:prepilin-type N-terminal cleavage/methylation domain-containing protein
MRFKAFTLIELLVVAAIIGLLSSIVVASLNTALYKAQDAAIREQAVQLRTVLEQEFSATGSYAALKSGGSNGGSWYGVGDTCAGFSGQFAAQAVNTCTGLIRATGTPCGNDGCVFFASVDADGNGTPDDSPQPNDKYSIMAYLQGTSRLTGQPYYLCLGSSGKMSVTLAGTYTGAGCWSNP